MTRLFILNRARNTPFSFIAEAARSGREIEVDDVILTLDNYEGLTTDKLKISLEEPERTKKKIKAYPLMLTAAISPDGKLELNSKPQTPESIAKVISQTFETRKKKRIFIQGSDEVEKTVFVYARPNTKFGDVLNLIKEIEKTGAYPIGLDVDDYYPKVIF